MATTSYGKLEEAASLLRKKFDDRSIMRIGIPAYIIAHALRKDEGLELARAFHIPDQETREEMSRLVKEVIKPLEMNMFVLRDKLGMGRIRYDEFSESTVRLTLKPLIAQYQCDDKGAIATFVMNYNGILESEHVQDKKNIKAAVILPQIISIMTTWLDRRTEFSNGLINAMRSNEKDPELKGVIDSIAKVNPLYKIVRLN
ncbi:MAG: hypothetical protein KGI06_04210 [Candidatus Micrarchaeota archaeon]|nr:hypothetical protein [Candidatus Micrarchaeota archaeon]